MMFAIMNSRTFKWVYGTDFRRQPHIQRTSFDKALIFESREEAEIEFKRRQCGKDYMIYSVRLEPLV